MVRSMFAAISGLSSHQTKMDVISNNIANVNTWGFKSRTANFQDALYQNLTNSTAGSNVDGGTGGINSSQLGYGVNVGSVSTSFTTGSRAYTGDGYNCMIDGTGFFIVGPLKGTHDAPGTVETTGIKEGGLYLSRVGIFSVDGNGFIVDDMGNHVYGFSVDDTGTVGTTLQPLRVPQDDPQVESISIQQDGSIVGARTDASLVNVGKIAVASVENPNGLEQKSGYLYEIGANAGTVTGIQTVASTTGAILSGYLEMSNVDLATDMANMITTQRGYQANSKMITVTDEMLEQLVNMKR